MPKKNNEADQPRLIKEQIPEMPEGYYSSGPNPNLTKFIEKYAKSFDIENDDYLILPFDKPIKTTKATAIYNMHTYWSKKPHGAIREYIRHYTEKGDLILDPLCGSGGTAISSLIEGRKAIAIDLSPAATFITKHYCTPLDLEELNRNFQGLLKKVQDEFDWLYGTRCDRCDGRAITTYVVYSYVFQCERCLEKVPLYDCIEEKGQTSTGKSKKILVCPNCYKQGHMEEISTTRNERYESIPVLVSYICKDGCSPKRAQRSHHDSNRKKREYFQKYDLGKIREIEEKEIPHWYPPHRMMNVDSDTEPWGDKWREGTSSFRTVAELFTKRNLWALASIKKAIRDFYNENLGFMDFVLNSCILGVSKMVRESNTATLAGTYYLPQISKELNVLSSFSNKFSVGKKGVQQINNLVKNPKLLISTQSATNLSEIYEESIDYIFTDPPYAGKMQYGELNFIWEAWLDFNTNWHDEEIIVNKTRGISDLGWANLMRMAMKECYRVLKPGRWLSLAYHDTSEGTWQIVQDIMTEIGFIPENSDQALYIDADQKSFNQMIAEKVTKRDLVINFRKPKLNELSTQLVLFGTEEKTTFVDKAQKIIIEILNLQPGVSSDHIYDNLVSRMVRKGEFERHNFDEILRSVAEEINGRWYLLETADQIDEAESEKEQAAAKRLEAFMVIYQQENPGEWGIHYSDLFEQYWPVQNKPRRLLQEWLPEFFFKTEEGTWRSPRNEEERTQKETLRTTGALRRIKRFANALIKGVPPYERDLPPNAVTAADWLRQSRRAGLYDQGRAIYEKGGFNFDELDKEALIEVEEDYQICVRRS